MLLSVPANRDRTASAASQFSTFLGDISAIVGSTPVTSAYSMPSTSAATTSASTPSSSAGGSGAAAAAASAGQASVSRFSIKYPPRGCRGRTSNIGALRCSRTDPRRSCLGPCRALA